MKEKKEDKLLRALNTVKEFEDRVDSIMTTRRQKWLDWYGLYRLFRSDDRQEWQSQIFIPKIFEVVEKIVPMLVAHDPKYVVSPRFNDNTIYMKELRDYLSFVWDEGKARQEIKLVAKGGCIYGTTTVKLNWKTVTSKRYEVEEEEDEKTGEMRETEFEIEEERMGMPVLDMIDIFDFKTDPSVDTLEESQANVHINENVRLSDLYADGSYENLDSVELLSNTPLQETTTVEKQQKLLEQGISTNFTKSDTYTVKEYWGLFSITGKPKDETEYIITTVNDAVVIKCEPNELGIRPFSTFKDKKVPGEYYGIGEVEPLEDLQIELNTLRNQRADYTNLLLNPEWLVSLTSGVSPTNLIHKPNNIILADDINGVKMLEKSPTPISGYQEESQILRDIQTVSQTTDSTDLGGSMGFNNTATGVRDRAAQQKVSKGSTIENLEEMIADVGQKFLIITKHFMGDSLAIKRSDPTKQAKVKFSELTREVFEDVTVGYNVKVEAGSTLEDSYTDKANQAVAMGNTSLQYAQAGVPIDMAKVFKDILKKTFFINDPESYMKQEQAQGVDAAGEQQFAPDMQSAELAQGAQFQPTLPKGT